MISCTFTKSYNSLHFQEDFANYEANEPFIQNLIMNLDGLLALFKGSVTTSNYDTLVSILATEVTTHMEKVVIKSTFNRVIIHYTVISSSELTAVNSDVATLAASSHYTLCILCFIFHGFMWYECSVK